MRAKLTGVVLIVLWCVACGGGRSGVEKIVENGVEVVLNRAEPVRLKGEPSTLTLEKVFVIDTEDDAAAALGVTDIYQLEVDPAGNSLILVPPTGPRNCVYKLSPDGKLLARVRGDRLYAVQEKPSGFKQLIVYRMTWR